MKRLFLHIVAIPCVVGAGLPSAVSQPVIRTFDTSPSDKSPKELVLGVVLNQTVTVQGQEFYRHFCTAWRDKEASERYNITVHERPNASRGSLIWVESSHRIVFRTILPPSRSQTRLLSEQAVEASYKAVVDTDMQRLLFRDQDMAADEI